MFLFSYFVFNLRFIALRNTHLWYIQDLMDLNTICLFIFLHVLQITFYSNVANFEIGTIQKILYHF